MAESREKLKTSNVVSSFIVCSNRNNSALLSYNGLFVGQLYEDNSLALHARDLIFFTSNLQTSIIRAARAVLFLKHKSMQAYSYVD